MRQRELPERMRHRRSGIAGREQESADHDRDHDAVAIRDPAHDDVAGAEAEHSEGVGQRGAGPQSAELALHCRQHDDDRPGADAGDRADHQRDGEPEPGIGRIRLVTVGVLGHASSAATSWEMALLRAALAHGSCRASAPEAGRPRDRGGPVRQKHPRPIGRGCHLVTEELRQAARRSWRPSLTSSMILATKAGRSSGLREVTTPLSVTTSLSSQFAPALIRSCLIVL